MLQSLYIKDFILIENLELDFDQGFSVITGDTGAGKSILLDSILFCLSEKNFLNPVRPGSNNCSVTLVFSKSNEYTQKYLENSGVDVQDELILKRTQTKEGNKKLFINDQIVSSKTMQGLFDYLMELNGQHNHSLLLNPASHIEILDEYGGYDSLKREVMNSYKEWQNSEQNILEFNKNKDHIEKEIDYLSHICQELRDIKIEAGEEGKLSELKRKYQNRDKEIKLIKSIISDIETSNIEQIISNSQRFIGDLNNSDRINEDFDLIYDKIEDIKSTLRQNLRELSDDSYSSEEIDDRLHEIRNLARKHSCSSEELSKFLEKSEEELQEYQSKFQENTNLSSKLEKDKKLYFLQAQKLSEERIKAAKNLEVKTMEELSSLELQKAIFKVEISTYDDSASVKGIDKVRFIASTNPGIAPNAINKIASGGELSRFMLAMRVALFNKSNKHTIIFDEIDVGISGAVADSIGQRLKVLSSAVQIIVITHQPQVAGKADTHILVKKILHNNHTNVEASTLSQNDKKLEIARMISGQKITESGIKAAEELLM